MDTTTTSGHTSSFWGIINTLNRIFTEKSRWTHWLYHRRLLTMDLERATIAGCSFYAWARRSLIHLSEQAARLASCRISAVLPLSARTASSESPMLLIHFVAASIVLCYWYPSIGLAFPIRCSLLVLLRHSRSPSAWGEDSTFASTLSSSSQSQYHQLGI